MVDRRKQAEEAKNRVLSGQYATNGGSQRSARSQALQRYYDNQARQGLTDQYTDARRDALQRSEQRTNNRVRNDRVESLLPDPFSTDRMLPQLTPPVGPVTPQVRNNWQDVQRGLPKPATQQPLTIDQLDSLIVGSGRQGGKIGGINDFLNGFNANVRDSATLGLYPYLEKKAFDSQTLAPIMGPRANYDAAQQEAKKQDGTWAGVAADLVGSAIPYAGAYKLAAPLIRSTISGLGPVASNLVRGTVAGGIYGTANELGEAGFGKNDQHWTERLQDVGINAALGGVGDAAFSAIGRGLKKVLPGMRNNPVPTPDPLNPNALNGTRSTLPLADARRVPGRNGLSPASEATPLPRAATPSAASAYERALADGDIAAMRAIDPDTAAKMAAYEATGGSIRDLPSFLRPQVLRSLGISETAPESVLQRAANSPTRQAKPDDAVGAFQQFLRQNDNRPVSARNTPEATVNPAAAETRPAQNVVRNVPEAPVQSVAGAGRNAVEAPTASPEAARVVPELPGGTRERGVVTSLAEQEKIPQEMTDLMRQNPNSRYTPITNADTVAKANLRLAEDIAKARNYVEDDKIPFDAEKAVTAQRLIDHYNSIKDFDSAASVADKLATEATKAGQFIQAQSLRDRLTPEGVLISMNKKVDALNKKLPKNKAPKVIDDTTKAEVMELAATAQKMQGTKNNANGVLDMLQNKKPGEKLTDSEISQIEVLLNDNRAFVKDATRRVRNTDSPSVRQPRDKRVQAALVDFFDKAEAAARQRIAARKGTLSSTPFDVWADWIIIGMSKMGKGTVKFADWSEEMVRDLGENVRPTLNSLFDRSKQAYEVAGQGIRAGTARKTKVNNAEFKALQDDMVTKVQTLIADTKSGNFTDEQLQAIRDSAEELVDAMPPANRKVPDAQKAYEQAVKSLANKLAGVEKTTVPIEETVQEVRRLLQTVSKATATPKPRVSQGLTETQNRIDEAGYALAGKARPDADALSMELNAYSQRANELIEKAKAGTATVAEMQEAVRVSEQIMQSIPEPQRAQLDEAKQMQQLAKSLVRTLQAPPGAKPPRSQAVQDMQRLLQTAQRLKAERTAPIQRADVSQDAERINNLARGLMERTVYKPLSPEEKVVRGLIRSKGDTLTSEQIVSLQSLAEGVTLLSGKERTRASQDLQVIMQGLEDPSFLRKISTVQTVSQLLNIKTQVRNILGNEMFYRVERLNKYVATPIDIARSKLTGTERTVTFRTNNQENFWKAWITGDFKSAVQKNHFTRGFAEGGSAGWRGVNVNGLETQFELQGQSFKGKYNPLAYMEKALGASLRSFDNASYTRAYQNTLGEMGTLDAINKGIKPTKEYVQNYIRNADTNILQLADDYGRFMTFQDNNVISQGLVKLKRGLNFNQDFGLGDLVLKYPKTPGALLLRALEYSPAGFARSAWFLRRATKYAEEGATKKFVENFSRATIGSLGFAGMGYALMDLGIMTTGASRDKDIRSLEQGAGKGGFQINLSALARFVSSGFDRESVKGFQKGDMLYTFDWAQPVAFSISIGSEGRKNIDEGKTAEKLVQGYGAVALNSVAGAFNTVTDQSVLRGIKDAAEGFPGQTPMDKVLRILLDAPSSFVPTAVNQVRQARDNTARETYDPNAFVESLNKVKNRIPGLADSLPPRYDSLGNQSKNFQDPSLFNIFANPGKPSTYNPDEVAQGILDLITETDDDTLAPRVPQKKLQGVPLTGEQYSELSRLQGEQNRERLGRINRDASTKSQTKKTEKAIDKSAKEAKKSLLREYPDLKDMIKQNQQ